MMPRQDFINQSGILLLMQMMGRVVQLAIYNFRFLLLVSIFPTIQVLPVLCEGLLESHDWPQHLMYPLSEVVDGFPLPTSLGLAHVQVIHQPL